MQEEHGWEWIKFPQLTTQKEIVIAANAFHPLQQVTSPSLD